MEESCSRLVGLFAKAGSSLRSTAGVVCAQGAWPPALGEGTQEFPVHKVRGGWALGSSRMCSTRLGHSLKPRMCLSLKPSNKM